MSTTTEQDAQLPPCPLMHEVAAGIILDKKDDASNAKYAQWYIRCLDCGLELDEPYVRSYHEPSKLVEAWSRRAEAASRVDGERAQAVLVIARQWADEVTAHGFDLSPTEQKLLSAVLAASTAPVEGERRCGSCGCRYIFPRPVSEAAADERQNYQSMFTDTNVGED